MAVTPMAGVAGTMANASPPPVPPPPMSPEERATLEARVRELVAAGAAMPAAEAVVRGYGPEVLAWLVGTDGGARDAADAFSQWCEDLTRGMASYRGDCSVRTYVYTLARHARMRHRRDPWTRRVRGITGSAISLVEQQVRESTLPFLRTEVKDRFALLRDELDPDDRDLLVLRVDRDLPWNDIVRVMGGDREPSQDDLRRGSAALRKRFERVKERLRQRAVETGLLGDER